MNKPLRLLQVEDSEGDAALVVRLLEEAGYEVHSQKVETAAEMHAALTSQVWDVIIADYALPELEALTALKVLQHAGLDIPFIVVSSTNGEDLAVEVMKAGAQDYLMKASLGRLTSAVEREIKEAQTRRERQKAQQGQDEREAELQAIFHGSPVMMCLVNPQREVERMNRTMAEFVGGEVSTGSLKRPGDLLECVNALDDPRGCGFGLQCHACGLRMAVLKTFETGQSCHGVEGEFFFTPDGLPRRGVWVSASTALVRLGNQPKVLVCLEDITARKRMETQFLQAQKVEAFGQLAGGIAHDFSNILAAALMRLELLQQKQNLDPDVLSALKELEYGTQRAASLTRQLLIFSRRQVMQAKRIDLNVVMEGLTEMLARVLGEDIKLSYSPSPKQTWIEADPGMLEAVVVSLCLNARDAMPKGGRLALSTRLLNVETQDAYRHPDARAGQFACLSVADTGCGMDKNTLQRIFEPYFTTKEVGKGTGLGLATAHGIIKQHQGWVEVESAVGVGTSFRVLLPSVKQPESVKAEAGLARAVGGTETILLVEDEKAVRDMVNMMLSRFGYEILEASNGLEAVQLWEKHGTRVNLLFTDMLMPEGFTGLELATRLRQSRPGLRVVISSGYSAELLQQEGQLPAGIRFLGKPYQANTLARTVRESLDQKT